MRHKHAWRERNFVSARSVGLMAPFEGHASEHSGQLWAELYRIGQLKRLLLVAIFASCSEGITILYGFLVSIFITAIESPFCGHKKRLHSNEV